MKVIASTGLKVPTEKNPREYITESEPVEIEVTAYYLRRLADNELVEVKAEVTEQPNPQTVAAPAAAVTKKTI